MSRTTQQTTLRSATQGLLCDDAADGLWSDRLLAVGGWRRRSLFSSERLDLIVANLRRNVDKYKAVSTEMSCRSRRDQLQQQQQLQQHPDTESDGTQELMTSRRRESPKTTVAGRCDTRLEPYSKNAESDGKAAELSCDGDDVQRTTGFHESVGADVAADGSSTSDVRPKKSVSFRLNTKHPSNDNERLLNPMYRSLPRSRQRAGHQLQTYAPASSPRTSSVAQSTNNISEQHSRSAIRCRSQDQDPTLRRTSSKKSTERSTCASRPPTYGDLTEEVKVSPDEQRLDGKQPCSAAERHLRCPASINWYIDLADSDTTPPLLSEVDCCVGRSQRCRSDSGTCNPPRLTTSAGDRLYSSLLSDGSSRRGRTTTSARPDRRLQSTDGRWQTASKDILPTSPAVKDDLRQKFAALQRTSATNHLATRSPKATEMSTNTENYPAAFGPSTAKFRRSMTATRPARPDVFSRANTATRSFGRGGGSSTSGLHSLSERYRKLIGGECVDRPSSAPVVASKQRKPTSITAPLSFSRDLKPDFVIYI